MPNIEDQDQHESSYDVTKPMISFDGDGKSTVQIPPYMYYGPPAPAETYDILDDERYQYGTPVTIAHIIQTYKLYNLPESVRYVIADRLMKTIQDNTNNLTHNSNEQPDTNTP
jgi:hypothetical protein